MGFGKSEGIKIRGNGAVGGAAAAPRAPKIKIILKWVTMRNKRCARPGEATVRILSHARAGPGLTGDARLEFLRNARLEFLRNSETGEIPRSSAT